MQTCGLHSSYFKPPALVYVQMSSKVSDISQSSTPRQAFTLKSRILCPREVEQDVIVQRRRNALREIDAILERLEAVEQVIEELAEDQDGMATSDEETDVEEEKEPLLAPK